MKKKEQRLQICDEGRQINDGIIILINVFRVNDSLDEILSQEEDRSPIKLR